MAYRNGAGRVLVGVALGVALAVLIVWVVFAGLGDFRAEDPAEVNGVDATPDMADPQEAEEATID